MLYRLVREEAGATAAQIEVVHDQGWNMKKFIDGKKMRSVCSLLLNEYLSRQQIIS